MVVPFAGTAGEAADSLEALARLELAPGDELLLVDNSAEPAVTGGGRVRVVRACERRSSYYARNVGAEAAACDWLLFLDADTVPPPDLLDRYFDEEPADGVGAVAGEVSGAGGQNALTARYARSRGHLVQRDILAGPGMRPMAVTANLLVRSEAFEQLGGFQEGIRSAGDTDFSWRLQDAGWRISYCAAAAVEHRHRETLGALVRQAYRIGGGRAWIARRHEGVPPLRPVRELARCAAGVLWWGATLRFERAAFKALDAVWVSAEWAGLMRSNAEPSPGAAGGQSYEIGILVDVFPALSETFVLGEVRALERRLGAIRVEACGRPARANWRDARGVDVTYWEDDGKASRLLATVRLTLRHPLAVLSDLRATRRWSAEEEVWPLPSLAACAARLRAAGTRHLHVHFAGRAALNALRLSRILGIHYSVTAHAYEIFQRPANLQEKIAASAFTAGESHYATDRLRELAGPAHRSRVHFLPAGVDARRFRRETPYPGGRCVVAVGRLIEKKGFVHLVDAAALLVERGAGVEVLIVGDGPLRNPLRERAAERGVDGCVRFLGARDHVEVGRLLERADLLAMPCVVAADGDRDSMPNAVYEALAMEVPVVASDEVGLPDVVRPEWGRLVPPGDPAALAAAVEEVLALPPATRAEMGRTGRAFVIEERDQDRQAERLLELIQQPGKAEDALRANSQKTGLGE